MIDLKLKVVRFQNQDVIATSEIAASGVALTAGEYYVTPLAEYRESGSVYNYNYDFVKFLYNPGEENHMAISGGFGSSSTVANKYTYAWYDGGSSAWYTENKTKGSYGGAYPTKSN